MISELEKYAEHHGVSNSQALRTALYKFLQMQEDIELGEVGKQILKRQEDFIDATGRLHLQDMENSIARARLKEITFMKHVDEQLANVYIATRRYKTDEEIVELMRDQLDSFKERAEWHDQIEEFEERYSDPLTYAMNILDDWQKEAENR